MPSDKAAGGKVKVLFVCTGNICRSPSAEAVLRNMAVRNGFEPYVEIASAGTHDYHVGEPADHRSRQAAEKRGIDMNGHRARHLRKEDFEEYDYILLMDEANYRHVMRICPNDHHEKVHYLMDFAPQLGVKEVPDPYYGGTDGFDRVLDLVETACAGLLSDIRDRHVDPPNLRPEINLG